MVFGPLPPSAPLLSLVRMLPITCAEPSTTMLPSGSSSADETSSSMATSTVMLPVWPNGPSTSRSKVLPLSVPSTTLRPSDTAVVPSSKAELST